MDWTNIAIGQCWLIRLKSSLVCRHVGDDHQVHDVTFSKVNFCSIEPSQLN